MNNQTGRSFTGDFKWTDEIVGYNLSQHRFIASSEFLIRLSSARAVVRAQDLITGSIARSAMRRYLIYSKADFEVFGPAGATRCTDGGEIWHGGGD